jgi:hypothetical protein
LKGNLADKKSILPLSQQNLCYRFWLHNKELLKLHRTAFPNSKIFAEFIRDFGKIMRNGFAAAEVNWLKKRRVHPKIFLKMRYDS